VTKGYHGTLVALAQIIFLLERLKIFIFIFSKNIFVKEIEE